MLVQNGRIIEKPGILTRKRPINTPYSLLLLVICLLLIVIRVLSVILSNVLMV